MTPLEAISIVVAVVLLVDIILTLVMTDGMGAITTCTKCNKKFDGSVLVAIFQQTIHRCDDQLML